MSRVIGAEVRGDLEERFTKAEEKADGTKSELIRELVDEGLRAREVPLFARLDLPDRMGARLEADREAGESQEAVIVRLLREAIEARDRDGLDELGVDDELREAIESVQEEGEPIEDATRRVLREAIAGRNQLQRQNEELRVYQVIGAVMVFGMLGAMALLSVAPIFGIESQAVESLSTVLVGVSVFGAIGFALVPVSRHIQQLL